MTILIEHRLPSVEEFIRLRAQTDWGVPDHMTAKTVLQRSFSGVVALENNVVVGMARTVGDGCLILYIQDVVLSASHRSQGLGKSLIQALLDEAAKTCLPSCTIGLFAAMGQDGFYEKLGFGTRNKPGYGPGMHGTLSSLAKPNNGA